MKISRTRCVPRQAGAFVATRKHGLRALEGFPPDSAGEAFATFMLFHGETADPLRISDLCAGRAREWSVREDGEKEYERGKKMKRNGRKERKKERKKEKNSAGKSNAHRRVSILCVTGGVSAFMRVQSWPRGGCLRVVRGCFRKLEPNTYTAKGLTERVSPAIVITHIEGVTPTGQRKGSEGERGGR